MHDIDIVRSSRVRRISLTLRGETPRVTAPPTAPDAAITQFVAEHADWINRRQQEHRRRCAALGLGKQQLLLEGLPMDVHRIPTTQSRSRVQRVDGVLQVSEPLRAAEPDAVVQRALIGWYREQARLAANDWVNQYREQFARLPDAVFIKDTRSRWGSCSSRNVNFSWRLMMAPTQVFEYVVVHELCHLDHPDHSPEFWDAVEARMPDYETAERWLKRYGTVLHALLPANA